MFTRLRKGFRHNLTIIRLQGSVYNLKFIKLSYFIGALVISTIVSAAPESATGKVTSLLSSGNDPAIRLTGNAKPDNCDAGVYGWLYFQGTPEEKYRVYSNALAFKLTAITVVVHTNGDGSRCRINSIQVLSH